MFEEAFLNLLQPLKLYSLLFHVFLLIIFASNLQSAAMETLDNVLSANKLLSFNKVFPSSWSAEEAQSKSKPC